jgi:hypothetical protein
MTRKIVLTLLAGSLVALPACGDDNKSKDSSSTGAKLSADTKKVFKASASGNGLGATSKSFNFQPGESVDGPGLENFIKQTVKQKTGLDVQVTCPASTQFTPGGVFYCRMTLPSGTAYDVRCTMRPDGNVAIEVVATQPTPAPPPSNPDTKPLGSSKGSVRGFKPSTQLRSGKNVAQVGTLDTSTLGDQIEQTIKQEKGLDVNVDCPAQVDNVVGATFYCKLSLSDGTTYDVECTIQDGNNIAWRVIV